MSTSSLDRMHRCVGVFHIETSGQAFEIIELFRNFWFRGQSDKNWSLTSTLEREAEIFGIKKEELWDREQVMLKLFKERAHLYTDSQDIPKNEFEWLALVRHYCGPSRLLDVTSSFLIATYFAIFDLDKSRDSSVWAFNDFEFSCLNKSDLSMENRKKEICIIKPDRTNVRLNAQNGAFIVPFYLEKSIEEQISRKFETNFSTLKEYKDITNVNENYFKHKVWKIIIKKESKIDLFKFLSRCNIRSYTLFPDIEGLSRSIREMLIV